MIYIVSGMPRSGTTMLMSALNVSGIPAVYSDELDQLQFQILREKLGDSLVEKTFYESGWNITEDKEELNGKVVKMFIGSLYVTSAFPDLQFKVVDLIRPFDDCIASWKRLSDQPVFRKLTRDELLDHVLKHRELADRQPNLDRIELHYKDVVKNPLKEMTKLVEFGFPIDPLKAAEDIKSGRSKRIK